MTRKRFNADLHLHIDDHQGGYVQFEQIARKLAASDIDIVSAVEHNNFNIDRLLRFREIVYSHFEQTRRQIVVLLGSEVTFTYNGLNFHCGIIFKDHDVNSSDYPDIPGKGCSLVDLEEFAKENNAMLILNHPTLKIKQDDTRAIGTVSELLLSGIFDSVEVINGTAIIGAAKNGREFHDTRLGLNVLHQSKSKFGVLTPLLGTSDSHNGKNIGLASTSFTGETYKDLFTAINRDFHTVKINGGSVGTNTVIRNGIFDTCTPNYIRNKIQFSFKKKNKDQNWFKQRSEKRSRKHLFFG